MASLKWLTIHSSAATASPGNLTEMQILRGLPDSVDQKLLGMHRGCGAGTACCVSVSPPPAPEAHTHQSDNYSQKTGCILESPVEFFKNISILMPRTYPKIVQSESLRMGPGS